MGGGKITLEGVNLIFDRDLNNDVQGRLECQAGTENIFSHSGQLRTTGEEGEIHQALTFLVFLPLKPPNRAASFSQII